jgi:hypothetical protein
MEENMTLLKYLAIGLCVALFAGCSSAYEAPDQEMIDLQDVRQLLHMAGRRTGRPPAKLSDLDSFQAKYSEGYNALKSGDYVVLWGTPLKMGKDAGKSEIVVAYGKKVPTDGGYVLTTAGKVTKMSPAEFAAAPKPRK